MGFDKIRFQKKLKELIGDNTQEEFGNKCGISRSNIIRMLSDSTSVAPSKKTLQKIASGTETRVEDLYVLCGYAESPAEARRMRPFKDRILLTASDMKQGFSEMTKGTRLYANIRDYLDQWIMFYSHENCKYAISAEKEYDGDLHSSAEGYVNLYLKIEDKGNLALIYFVLYFAKTRGGKYIIVDFALDGQSLEESEFATAEQLEKMGMKYDSIRKKDVVYYLREDAKSQLLKAIFGENDDKTESYIYAFTGFGFEMPSPGRNFKAFIENHKDTLKNNTFILDYLKSDKSPEMYFKEFEDDSTWQAGFQAAVSWIMKEETSLPFEFYSSENPSTGERTDCIIIPEALKDYDLEKLKKAVYGYAKELGIEEFGECVSFQVREIERKFRFSTKEVVL